MSDCPTSDSHGNPFRYCACGWTEPTAEQVIEDRFREISTVLGLLPDGREKSIVATKLDEAALWAAAAIRRNNKES